jgi:hypothetical protein
MNNVQTISDIKKKYLFRYWDKLFKDCYLCTSLVPLKGFSDKWSGIVNNNNEMIIGNDCLKFDYEWYYDNNLILRKTTMSLFNLSYGEFNELLVQYFNEKYRINLIGVF